MLASVRAAAPVTLMSTIDATNLVNLRQQFKAVAEKQSDRAASSSVSYSDIVLKLTALALPVLFLAAACADPGTSVPSRTSAPTPAQRTRDTLDPARGPAEAAGRAADRATNPNRP